MTTAVETGRVLPGGVSAPTTVPAWLLHHAATRPGGVALRVKQLGRWREVSWRDHAARVASVGRALAFRGVGPGDRVLLVSENRPEWIVTDLAVQGLGAMTVGVFPTTPAPELAGLLRRSGARIAVVEGEEQLDNLMEVRAGTPLERIFVIDPRGIRRLEAPAASFEELESLGSLEAVALREGDPDVWREAVARLEPDGGATVVFTPGTTGDPKGVMLTNRNLAAAAAVGVEAYGLRPGDRIVSCLPMCEIAERVLVVAQATRAASTVHFGEGGDALENDVREVEPTVFLGAPHLWERFEARVDAGLRTAGRVKRAAFRAGAARRGGVARLIGAWLVTRPVRRQLGLARVRVALVGGAPAPAALLAWWDRLGIPVRALYGLSESTGVGTVVGVHEPSSGTVGRAVPGVEIAIADHADTPGRVGEVLLRGRVVFAGYLDDGEASAEALDAGGWLHTGDVGSLDADGRLTIVDRIKDVIVTSGSHTVAPGPIERRLAATPFIRAAVVLGDGRPHLGALLAIDVGAVSDWAAQHGVPFTTRQSLITQAEVHELIDDCVREVNDGLIAAEQIRCFALLPNELGQEEGVLTDTLKIRRKAITARFAGLVDGMFS
ncbi:MAG: AMP-binding protein [Acidimicrobiia bacterium]